MDIADMIAMLELDDFCMSEKTLCTILDMEEESFPLLARLATHDEYWDDLNYHQFIPISATYILAEMKHYRAQLAINTAIMMHYEEDESWLLDHVPDMLAHMGVGAIPTLTAFMRYCGADALVRFVMAEALVLIATDNPDVKPGIVASIKDLVRIETDDETRILLVDSLLGLDDPAIFKYVENFLDTQTDVDLSMGFKSNLADVSFTDMLDALRKDTANPLNALLHFGDRRHKHAGGSTGAKAKPRTSRKVGRNEPCPCGSKKKYKKCCMLKA